MMRLYWCSAHLLLLLVMVQGVQSKYQEKSLKQPVPLCGDRSMFDYGYLNIFSPMKRNGGQKPRTVSEEFAFCHLETSCCAEGELVKARAAFISIETTLDISLYIVGRFFTHPEDVLVLEEISQRIISPEFVDSLRRVARGLLTDDILRVFEAIDSFMKALMGYFSGMICASCLPDSDFHIFSADSFLDEWEIELDQQVCDEMVGALDYVIGTVAEYFKDHKTRHAVVELMNLYCLEGIAFNVRCSEKEMKRLYDKLVKAFASEAGMHNMLCSSDKHENCFDMLCRQTLRGLAIDLSPLYNTTSKYIQEHCPNEAVRMCHSFQEWFSDVVTHFRKEVYVKPISGRRMLVPTFGSSGKVFNVVEMAKKSQMTSYAFEKSTFAANIIHSQDRRRPGRSHRHHSSFLWRVLKGIFYTVLLGGVCYVGWIVYQKKKDGELDSYYSVLAASSS